MIWTRLLRYVLPVSFVISSLFVDASAWAANAFVQANRARAFGASSVGVTFGSNTTTGNLVACFVWWDTDTDTLNSITDSQSNTYTLLHNPTTLGTARAAMGYAKNITGGTTPTVTANFSGSPGDLVIGCMEISGANTTAPLDQSAMNTQNFPGTGTDLITSGSVTTTTDGEFIFGGTRAEFGTTVTAGTNFTLDASGAGHANIEHRTSNQPSAGSIAATFTPDANDGYITGIMTFIAADAGGGGPDTSKFRRRVQ